MRGLPTTPLADLARKQGGVVTLNDLRRLGIGEDAVQKRVRAGSLHRLHRGVYAVGHLALTPRGILLAAVFAGGPGAVASHRSAAALWGIRQHNGSKHDVTAPARRRSKKIAFHQARLAPDDVITVDGISCTTVARTLLDLADLIPRDPLARAIHEAEVKRVLDHRDIEGVIERGNGRRGVKVLAELTRQDVTVTRSELERRFLSVVDAVGLPRPSPNTEDLGPEIDAIWPEARVTVELDGAATHMTRKKFESDRRRDAELQANGWRTLRFTWRQVTEDPAYVARVLAACLR